MHRFYLLLIACCFIVSFAEGQTIKGRVYELNTRIALADIQVYNTNNSSLTTTDDKGRFSINAKKGDILIFKGFTYVPDTVLVTDLAEKEVFLMPRVNLLNEVNITKDTVKSSGKSYDPMFHGQTVRYTRDADLNPTGGITLRLWYNKKDERQREKIQKELQDQKVQDKINLVFTPENIGKYVPLKGKDLDDFIDLYMPTVDVFNRKDFNLTVYLNDRYREYLKLPESERHPAKLGE